MEQKEKQEIKDLLLSIASTIDSDQLDYEISWNIDNCPEIEFYILTLIEEKQRRIENEIYISEKKSFKKKSKKELKRIQEKEFHDFIFK